jgi:hypothetical protein
MSQSSPHAMAAAAHQIIHNHLDGQLLTELVVNAVAAGNGHQPAARIHLSAGLNELFRLVGDQPITHVQLHSLLHIVVAVMVLDHSQVITRPVHDHRTPPSTN